MIRPIHIGDLRSLHLSGLQEACGCEAQSDLDLRDAAFAAAVRRVAHHRSAAEGYAEALCLETDRHSLLAALQDEQSADRRRVTI